jgi:hypothetical protein
MMFSMAWLYGPDSGFVGFLKWGIGAKVLAKRGLGGGVRLLRELVA